MKSIFKKLLVFTLALTAFACKDDATNSDIPESGTIEVTIDGETWKSTSVVAYAGSVADSSAAVISGIKYLENSEFESYITLIVANAESANLRATYPVVESEEETTLTKAAAVLYLDNEGTYWYSTEGELVISSSSNSTLKGTFEVTLTDITYEDDEEVMAKVRKGIMPSYKLGTRQLNATLSFSNGGFNVPYSDFEDEDWD
ncbi:hypothetical protein EP331_02770 [bacterium]|nr:MAG: hypothetical protein EP331_02770 [bacterium]